MRARPYAGNRHGGWTPRLLFSSGAQGTWFDPADFSTLYQDSAGTTPVTATGQPVGMLLDKSQGLARGPEKLTNGDFGAGSTGWSVSGNDTTHIATFAGGTLRYQSDTTTPTLVVSQANALVIGKTYEVITTIASYTSGSLTSGAFSGNATLATGPGTFRAIAVATATTFTITRGVANTDITLDSISVKELPGNHATQATATSRPTLQQDASGYYYLSFDGVDDFLVTAAINFTATDKMAVFVGLTKLNDNNGVVIETSAVADSNAGAFNVFSNTTLAFRLTGTTTTFAGTGSLSGVRSVVASSLMDFSGTPQIIGRINGAQVTSSSSGSGTGPFGNYPLYVGERGGATFPDSLRLYSVAVVGAAQSAANITLAERFCGSRMGIAL